MAKRFTDTEKWRDDWWGSLGNDYRMIWLYLVDSCSIAGIWKKDFRGLNFNCNTKISEKEFLEVFGERLIDRGNFFFIPKFLRFQYPKGLNSNKPAVIAVVKELQLNNLIQTVNESFGNDYLIIKDKDKDKDKDKVKDKDTDNTTPAEFEIFGTKKDSSISVRSKFLHEKPKRIFDLEKYFDAMGQLEEIKRAGWHDFDGFMRKNPAAVFDEDSHLYNSFRKYSIDLPIKQINQADRLKNL